MNAPKHPVSPAHSLTPLQQIRHESVKLAYRHDRQPSDIILRADELAAYIMNGTAPAKAGNDGQAAQ